MRSRSGVSARKRGAIFKSCAIKIIQVSKMTQVMEATLLNLSLARESSSSSHQGAGATSMIQDFCSISKDFQTQDKKYLDNVSQLVNRYRPHTVLLNEPEGYTLRIGGLNDTIYAEMEDELEAWEKFYLPERVEMRVIGAIDNFPSLAVGLQLIILAGRDGKIYAYENEVLHQAAGSLQDLFKTGIEFPGTKVYNYGERFAPMTEDEYKQLRDHEEVKKIKKETKEFIKSSEAEFLELLGCIKKA
ncbi:uncharacterized protein LOC117434218 [Acipenser ruthenus]|uniref:uncharacterized protein LOC117434218 n=1 Tax=Acipenser ruthenus TaxID=7906 RepID=UPI002740F5D3|nr:uncharacterized protein LOC117434218 [Acipenser ruthenus]